MPIKLSCWSLGLAFNLLFWLAAVALDFPRTYFDDSVIIGPAISIAETGLLRNPYLSRSFYPGDMYLFYPPGFFWVLGGWIALFGKSVLSLALFWAACGLIASACLAVLLQRLSGSKIAWAVAPLLVFGCIAYTGHRYEILAFATFFAGLVLQTTRSRGVGYLLLILTPTIAPTFLALCTVSVMAILAHRSRDRFAQEALLVLIGLTVASLTIVAGVGGDIAGLVETMYEYRSVRVGVGGRDIFNLKLIVAVISLNFLTATCWLRLAGQDWRSLRFQLPLLLSLAMIATLVSHARPALIVAMNIASITLAALAIGDALAAAGRRHARLRHITGIMPALGLGSVGAILVALNTAYIRMVVVPPLNASMISAAQAAAALTPAGLVIVADPRVIKEALAFPSDRRVEDSMVRNPWPDYSVKFDALPDDESWIISRATLVATVDPASMPTNGGGFFTVFVAAGIDNLPNDSICRIDAKMAHAWDPERPSALVEAACPRDTAP